MTYNSEFNCESTLIRTIYLIVTSMGSRSKTYSYKHSFDDLHGFL